MSIGVYIFAKPPRPGEVKTRLARTVGPGLATRFAAAFLADTVALVREAGLEPVIATTDTTFPFGLHTEVVEQGGGDLGQRLDHVLRDGLQRHGLVVALGADSPTLPVPFLRGLVAELPADTVRTIPAEDGGFVALATRRLPTGVFTAIPWSSAHTLEAVEGAFRDAGCASERRAPWYDVDEEADLDRLVGCGGCTAEVLSGWRRS